MKRDHMTARVVPLASSEAGDPRMGGSVEQRLDAVAQLTAEAWRLSGRAMPAYTRETMPVVVTTLQDHARDTRTA